MRVLSGAPYTWLSLGGIAERPGGSDAGGVGQKGADTAKG